MTERSYCKVAIGAEGPLNAVKKVNVGQIARRLCLPAKAMRLAAFTTSIALAACQPIVLDPQGPIGDADKTILVDSVAIMLAIVVPTIVTILAVAWWFRASNLRARYQPGWAYSGRIELVVWGIPFLVIMLLGGVAWIGSHDLDPAKPLASNTPPLEVQVVSLDWKWLFIYPRQGIATVNHLVVPVGVPIHFSLTSAGVMNAFFIPQLGSMIYTMYGMATQLYLQADAPGTFIGLSSQFSGDGFAAMNFDVKAVPADHFAAWVDLARATGPTLDRRSYLRLSRQSVEASPLTFREIDPGLFQQIVTQKLPPGPGPQAGLSDLCLAPQARE